MANKKKTVMMRSSERIRRLPGIYCGLAILIGFMLSISVEAKADASKVYQIVYEATLDPKTRRAHVSLTLTQPRRLVTSRVRTSR